MRALRRQTPERSDRTSSQNVEDATLIAAVLRKDRKASAEFVARFADDIYRYIRSRVSPRYDQVDDLVQEVFLAAWGSLSNYRGDGPLQAWLMGIARHKVEDFYRERLRVPNPIEDVDQDLGTSTFTLDFHRSLEREQLRKKTYRVLVGLPEKYRLALIWRYWEKASTREMALKTGRTEKAIERLLARARVEFRERWNHAKSS